MVNIDQNYTFAGWTDSNKNNKIDIGETITYKDKNNSIFNVTADQTSINFFQYNTQITTSSNTSNDTSKNTNNDANNGTNNNANDNTNTSANSNTNPSPSPNYGSMTGAIIMHDEMTKLNSEYNKFMGMLSGMATNPTGQNYASSGTGNPFNGNPYSSDKNLDSAMAMQQCFDSIDEIETSKDGNISIDDLKASINSSKCSQALRVKLNNALQCNLIATIDKNNDNKINKDELQSYINEGKSKIDPSLTAKEDQFPQAYKIIKDNFAALTSLDGNKDNGVNLSELTAIMNGNYSADIKLAVNTLLNNANFKAMIMQNNSVLTEDLLNKAAQDNPKLVQQQSTTNTQQQCTFGNSNTN